MDEIAPSIARPGVLAAAAAAAARIGAAVDLRDFRLAGGTALAWHLGHRVSEDLDFFAFEAHRLNTAGIGRLATELRLTDPAAQVRSGERTVHANIADCKVSFFELSGRWIEPAARVREGLDVASVLEIAAMKLVAVMTRCAKKDFFDIVAITDAGLGAREMYDAGEAMYPGFAGARAPLLRSLAYFDEAETDPDPVSLVGASWAVVKQRMRTIARDL